MRLRATRQYALVEVLLKPLKLYRFLQMLLYAAGRR